MTGKISTGYFCRSVRSTSGPDNPHQRVNVLSSPRLKQQHQAQNSSNGSVASTSSLQSWHHHLKEDKSWKWIVAQVAQGLSAMDSHLGETE